jgi:hypothetical protein
MVDDNLGNGEDESDHNNKGRADAPISYKP